MDVRLSTLSSLELSALEDVMAEASKWFRVLGFYSAAGSAKALASECSQHLLRREADRRQEAARQLSLCPPGAYDHPQGA
jgi:hypothetical protein